MTDSEATQAFVNHKRVFTKPPSAFDYHVVGFISAISYRRDKNGEIYMTVEIQEKRSGSVTVVRPEYVQKKVEI